MPKLVACFLCLFVPTVASAQTQPAPAAPTQASLEDELTSTPIIGQAGVSITAGGTFLSGRTDQRQWMLDGIFAHTTAKRTLLRFEAEMDFGQHRSPAATRFTEVEDHHLFTALVMHPLRPRLSVVGLGNYRRDDVLRLNYRVDVGGGIALHLVEQRTTHLVVIPMFVVGDESREHTDEADGVADFGVMQQLATRVNERVMFEQSFKANADSSEFDDHNIRFDASVTSQLVRHVNLKVYVQSQRDGFTPPGHDAIQNKMGVAVQVAFARR